jgi:helix-turn-helix, Psq domain
VSGEPDELTALREAFPGYRFRRKEIRGSPSYLAEAKGGVKGETAGAAAAPLAAARSPAILAAMLAAAVGRPLRLRPEAVAAAYRDQLMTVRQCARMFGVSRTTIVKFLSSQGVALRRPGDGVDDEAVVTAYRDQRLSLHECAARFGISQRRVTVVLDKHGVPRRPVGRPARRS